MRIQKQKIMKKFNFPFLILLIMSLISFRGLSAVCTATASGNWNNPTIWSCGSSPGCGDFVIIPSGITVTINAQVNLDENSTPACSTATYIQVSGTLQFITGNKLNLSCLSGLEVMPGGSMLPGGGGGSSNWLSICEDVLWKTSDGPVTSPQLFGAPIPLSTEFKSFSVENNKGVPIFNWVLVGERNNDFFQVDYSKDALTWNYLFHEISIGDHSTFFSYQKVGNFACERGYYRLSATDKNGVTTILDVDYVNDLKESLMIFPNPVESGNKVYLSVDESNKPNSFQISSYSGQIILKENVELLFGENVLEIFIKDMPAGSYILEVNYHDSFLRQRLIVR
jgi:hypothetical protein